MSERIPSTDTLVRSLVVAIDGPAGSGKSTTAHAVARRLGLRHIDTGAMYRAVTLSVLSAGVDVEDESGCAQIAQTAEVRLECDDAGDLTVWVGERDVTDEIRSPQVTAAVSAVSAHPGVRNATVRRQRRVSDAGGVVLEGRDIGTVVLPGADVKVFLDASARVRAQRRRSDLAAVGIEAPLEQVEAEISRRDTQDSSRKTSPLRRAVGAIRIDTSEMTVDEQVDAVVAAAREAAERQRTRMVRPPGPDITRIRFWYWMAWKTLRIVLRLFWGFRMGVREAPRLHEHYIYASNHVSNVDPPVVGCTCKRELFFLAKPSLFKVPVFGRLLRSYNAVPVRRGIFDRETMAAALEWLCRGKSTLIFPEASRIKGGQLGKPRNGVGYLAINSGVAVVPIYVRGTRNMRESLWCRGRVAVLHGRPIRIDGTGADEFNHNDGYRQYSEMVMEAIAALRDELEGSADGP